MTLHIDRDQQRFKQIVRGKIRDNLRKYITHGEVLGRKGREVVSIPVPNIEIPHFRHGNKGSGGVGQGDGDVGQPIGKSPDEGDGQGQAGDQPGQHIREAELTIDELAEMLGQELKLPRIEPKGQNTIKSIKTKYEVRDSVPVIMRLPEIDFIDDKEGKPVGINKFIGKRPIAAFGNSDGDFQMLEWTTTGSGRRLGLIVHHDDAKREYAYDRQSHIGKLDKALGEGQAKGWTVVDMKRDWRKVFAFEP